MSTAGAGRLGERPASPSFLAAAQPDLLYCNTIDCTDALRHLFFLRAPAICHVHELDFSFRHGVGQPRARPILARAAEVIACSRAVAEYLIAQQGIPAERITTVYEFIDSAERPPDPKAADAHPRRATGGRGGNGLTVAACGSVGWRKGTDLFLQLALQIRAACPEQPVRFIWIGGVHGTDEAASAEIEHDLRGANLAGTVWFLGEQPDPAVLLAGCDIFVLPSREDPFPLVCLESASLGKPIVCFAGAGGMPEFVEDDCGIVVPYLDVPAMAAAVLQLLRDGARRRRLGENGRAKVAARHSIEAGAREIEKVIQAVAEPLAA